MGDNWYGQLGIRKNVGIIMDEYVNQPTPVVEENLKGRKIVDFDLGGNTLLILTGFYCFFKEICSFSIKLSFIFIKNIKIYL